jgi:hypothetical protein
MPLSGLLAASLVAALPIHQRDLTTVLALFAGALYLPSILLARYVAIPFWSSAWDSFESLRTHLPPLLFGVVVICGLVSAGARVCGWNARTATARRRLRFVSTTAYLALWIPLWLWILGRFRVDWSIAVTVTLVTHGVLAVLDHIITPRVEDKLMPVQDS